jgi:hypothetical protein
VVCGWPGQGGVPRTRLAIALDATSLADKPVILSVSVVSKGCAVPIT